jgi:hypothetical protein
MGGFIVIFHDDFDDCPDTSFPEKVENQLEIPLPCSLFIGATITSDGARVRRQFVPRDSDILKNVFELQTCDEVRKVLRGNCEIEIREFKEVEVDLSFFRESAQYYHQDFLAR